MSYNLTTGGRTDQFNVPANVPLRTTAPTTLDETVMSLILNLQAQAECLSAQTARIAGAIAGPCPSDLKPIQEKGDTLMGQLKIISGLLSVASEEAARAERSLG